MIEAWHFVGATLRDGRPIPPDGEWLVHTGRVKMCTSGLHASIRPAHALEYAPGTVLCRVECDGIVEEQADKLVCRRRRIIERVDVTETLRYFARRQALSVVHMWDAPEVVLDYLMTSDESRRAAARDAAWAAARDAAWAAARDAAWAAARDAAWAAACAAARDAAWAAARDAAWAAACAAAESAAWDSARAAGDAARDAAKAAAKAAAWASAAAASREFDALIYEQFGIAQADAALGEKR